MEVTVNKRSITCAINRIIKGYYCEFVFAMKMKTQCFYEREQRGNGEETWKREIKCEKERSRSINKTGSSE